MGLLQSESQRVKIRHHKTQTGCLTCRSRRVKCDEEKPECGRCRRSGRQCAGYKIPVPWLFEPTQKKAPKEVVLDRRRASADSDNSNSSREHLSTDRALVRKGRTRETQAGMHLHQALIAPLLRPISIIVGDTPYERRAFQLYVDVAPTVCEVAEEADLEMLTVLIPQASHDFKLLRSATLCISSFFLSLVDPAHRERYCMVAEYQYMRIIKSMVASRLSSPNWKATVMLCLLLVVIEAQRNDHKRALTHLQAAVSINRENQPTTEACLMDGRPPKAGDFYRYRALFSIGKFPSQNPIWLRPGTNFCYGGLYEAMKTICTKLRDFRVLAPHEKKAVQQACLDVLQQTAAEVFQMLRDQQSDGKLYPPQEANLQIQNQVCQVVLSNLHRSRLCMFHGCDEHFNDILVQCDRFSDANNRGDAILTLSQATPVRFTFSTEFILYLFFVATECHSLVVRRKAIHALRRCCRREKYWDSFQAASIAEWLLKEEEKQREGQQQDTEDEPATRLLLSSLQLFQEDDGLLAFRRPEWAKVEVEDVQGVKEYWLDLGEAAFGSPPPKTMSYKPTKRKLCVKLCKPIWPSAAKTIGQICMFGEVRGLVDLP